ncbi:iron complex outermembrane receptor protein [Luteibacter jiangsuensis]|uniref:Iron complex outermembrane receptor protein n=1 Tax=Luteibacter jiangsuensis TaxID=637577 RepID=A0ABT9SZR3_9GAMM|nr:TonB-dependent receptor [Luteibacter jiangsuensis]MDQ0010505.1 iron complex outermembrane receptor protein [Luteibacter jiangsuensis]
MKHAPLTLAIGLAIGFAATLPAMAQDAGQANAPTTTEAKKKQQEATQLTEVTVSARRREESLEKVPVAVSAFSEEDMKDLQATSIDGLQGAVPNMNIVQGRGSSSSVNIFIRGIGQPDALQTFDPGVGMYVDDVYYSRIQGALISLFDVDHVEVLRGPQGTLYGKNSTGGAVKVVTKNPGATPEGSVEATFGNYGRREGRFYGSTPLGKDGAWSASLAGAITRNDGYVHDYSGHDFNNDDTKSIRGKLRFHPSDTFDGVLALDYTKMDTALTLGQPVSRLTRTDLVLGTVTLLQPNLDEKYNFHTRTSFPSNDGQELTHKGVALNMNWKLSDQWNLKSITAYRKLDSESYIDIDASQFELGDVFVGFHQKQASQELQLAFDNGSNLQSVFGAYFLRENVPSTQYAFADDLFAIAGRTVPFLRTIGDDLTTKSWAGFAHVNWEFVPSWTLAAGIRYSRESKDYDRTTSTFWGAPLAALNETVPLARNKDWTAWTPTVSLQKQFDPQTMWYVSASRGFKSGGFNGRANSAAEAKTAEFDPEYVWTFETGLKLRSADNRLQANLAAFHSNYKDFQARVSEIQNPGSLTPTFAFPVINAAKLKMDGFEAEGVALVGEGTRLSTQIGYLKAKYDRFDDARLDPSNPQYNPTIHDHVPFSPKWTARVAATQTFNLAGGALTVGADASYRTETWLSVDNYAALSQKAYTLVGAFGIFDSGDGHWQFRAGVRNATNKVYKTDGQEFSSVGNIRTAYYGMPRNYYASVRYNF